MFEALTEYKSIIVTGPHRSGTTIAAEMIATDTDKPCIREEAFKFRNIIEAERLLSRGGVFQGPYLLPWTPILAGSDALVVYMHRNPDDVAKSIQGLKARKVSTPFFSQDQALRWWESVSGLLPHALVVNYDALSEHPMWKGSRDGWGHRQTC